MKNIIDVLIELQKIPQNHYFIGDFKVFYNIQDENFVEKSFPQYNQTQLLFTYRL